MELHSLDLRRYLVVCLLERGGAATTAELIDDLRTDGFRAPGRASRTVPDAFRTEVARGRVIRIGRGQYAIGRLPRTTKHRMVHHVRALRAGVAP